MDTYALEEEKPPNNNAIAESQLTGLQYKLTQWGGKYSSGRTKKIIEPEIHGMREAIPKAETDNFYGGRRKARGNKWFGEA